MTLSKPIKNVTQHNNKNVTLRITLFLLSQIKHTMANDTQHTHKNATLSIIIKCDTHHNLMLTVAN